MKGMNMNNSREQLREEVRDRLQNSFSDLDTELKELQSQGLLSSLDRKKIMADAEISARAVREALERTDYPEQMQRELIMRLIAQFENSIKDIASKSRSKVFDTKFIYQRLSDIEKTTLKNLGIADKQTKLETSELKRIRDSYSKRIKELGKVKNIDNAQIDYAYQDYEHAFKSYASQFLPKIETQIDDRQTPVTPNQATPRQQPSYPSNEQKVRDIAKEKPRPEKKSSFFSKAKEFPDRQKEITPKRIISLRKALIIALVLVLICYLCSFTAWLPKFLFHILRFIF
jgi:hypothetical protein